MIATKYVILMWVARTSATSQGALPQACESLTPQHGDAKPQNGEPPYNVKVHEADSETREIFQSILYKSISQF